MLLFTPLSMLLWNVTVLFEINFFLWQLFHSVYYSFSARNFIVSWVELTLYLSLCASPVPCLSSVEFHFSLFLNDVCY